MIGIYKKEEALSNAFFISGVPIFKLYSDHLLTFYKYLVRLRRIIVNENVTIVHAHQRIDTIISRIACIGMPVKIVQTFHDFDYHYSSFGKFLTNQSFKIADRNVFVSEYQLAYYLSNYKSLNKLSRSRIYNGIDFSKFKSLKPKSIREEYNISDHSLLLGMVGNFNDVRDHKTVCRFMILLKKENVKFSFLFIGGKEKNNPHLYYECLAFCEENQISDNVIFLGSRPDAQVIIPQLDAFIYSSDHDTFGISVIEAIASGIPVFVNDWAVMKEITQDGQRAHLFKSNNEYDLLEKFIPFCQDPKPYIVEAKMNAKWARKKFSIQQHINKLQEIYSGLR